mmetsp:Transcript_73152/g.101436  ORF Transcript_73152/g.101436 Transcript_73152/m.101436 type:complete len:227 (+) Transcript_73152:19-699(+)
MKSGLILLVGIITFVLAETEVMKDIKVADLSDDVIDDWVSNIDDFNFDEFNNIVSAKGRSGGSRGSRSRSSYSSGSRSKSSYSYSKSGYSYSKSSYSTSKGYSYYNSASYLAAYTGPAYIAIYGYPGPYYHAYGYTYSNCGYNCYPTGCYYYTCGGGMSTAGTIILWIFIVCFCCCCCFFCIGLNSAENATVKSGSYSRTHSSHGSEGGNSRRSSFSGDNKNDSFQ